MLWISDKLSDHGLDYSYVAIESTAYDSPGEGNPEVGGKTNK